MAKLIPTKDAVKNYVRNTSINKWVETEVYALNEIVFRNGNIYKSLIADNTGNDPSLDEEELYWELTGGGAGSSITEYEVHPNYDISVFKIGTPVAIVDGKAAVASKNDPDRVNVVGLVAKVKDSGSVDVQKIALIEEVDPSLLPGTLSPGISVFLGDYGTLITDTNLIVLEEHRVHLGYLYSETSLDIQLSEPVLISDNPQYWDSVPIGGLIFNSSSFVREGYMRPDGRELERILYSALNQLYMEDGYPFGDGDGSTTFNLPKYEDPALLIKVRNVSTRTKEEHIALDAIVNVPSLDYFPTPYAVGQSVWRYDLDAFFRWNGSAWIETI